MYILLFFKVYFCFDLSLSLLLFLNSSRKRRVEYNTVDENIDEFFNINFEILDFYNNNSYTLLHDTF